MRLSDFLATEKDIRRYKGEPLYNWDDVIIPMLKKTKATPSLIAKELVSIKPLSAPTGTVFFLDYIDKTKKTMKTKKKLH